VTGLIVLQFSSAYSVPAKILFRETTFDHWL
jgi:hypothetical protein